MTGPTHLQGEHSEAGFSLIEIMLAVAIMGITFVALLTGMATAAQSAGLHRTQAVAELEVRRYAEIVESGGWSVTASSGTYSVTAVAVPTSQAQTAPYSLTADPASVKCVNRSSLAERVPSSGSPCDAATEIQKLTLTVHSPGASPSAQRVRESVEIVKVP